MNLAIVWFTNISNIQLDSALYRSGTQLIEEQIDQLSRGKPHCLDPTKDVPFQDIFDNYGLAKLCQPDQDSTIESTTNALQYVDNYLTRTITELVRRGNPTDPISSYAKIMYNATR